jgi:flagellar basal-body rod protein FlgF
VNFENPQELVQAGDTLLTGETPLQLTDGKVIQGAIEQSNVQGVEEITRLIEITRAYETISKLMKDTDDLRQNAISTLGRLEA